MAWGKIAGLAATAIASAVTAYVVGGEKYKDKEDRSDYKSGYNKGKAENREEIKAANDNAERWKRENTEFLKHQEQARALIILGLAIAGCDTVWISTKVRNEICEISLGVEK